MSSRSNWTYFHLHIVRKFMSLFASNFHRQESQKIHHFHETQGQLVLRTLWLQLPALEVCANIFAYVPSVAQVGNRHVHLYFYAPTVN